MEKTVLNLKYSFLHESQMISLYKIFSRKAAQEGYNLISNFFEDISNNKQQNAYWTYMMLQKLDHLQNIEESSVKFEDIPSVGTTSENLTTAVKIEDYEWRIMYDDFANTAREEGFDEIASRLQLISDRERKFFERFKIFSSLFSDKKLMRNQSIVVWECQGCGFQIAKETLPEDWVCPSCGHLKSYFEKKFLNYATGDRNLWICMECGEEVNMENLPRDWKCPNCGRPNEYFRRKKSDNVKDNIFSLPKSEWECMECGNTAIAMDELPDDWKCINCGASKSYFRRISSKPSKTTYSIKRREKAMWYCPSCGKEVEIDLPPNWKCPSCGFSVY